jgi:HK97 family phage major capsid protein
MTIEKQIGVRQSRSLTMRKEDGNAGDRTVTLAFASEEPVERGYGIEILSCDPAHVDLSRMLDGAPLLCDHDVSEQIGVVESATVDADRKCRAVVRFSKGEDGEEMLQDVLDGIRRKCSVGYEVTQLVDRRERADGVTEFVWAWKPYEISLTAVPADNTVGVGRSAEAVAKSQETEVQKVHNIEVKETRKMETEITGERARTGEILALGQHHKMTEEAHKAVAEGASADQFRAQVLKTMEARVAEAQKPQTIGMNQQEVRNYSMVRAINALANGQPLTGMEKECHEAMLKDGKKTRSGLSFMVPADVIIDRNFSSGQILTTPANQGGYAVQTNVLGGSFVDILRNKMVLSKLGVTMLTGLTGDVLIPGKLAKGAIGWVAEGSATNLDAFTFRQIPLIPKTIRGAQAFSRKMLIQSSVDVESLVRQDLAASIGVELDRVGLAGSGIGAEPKGILNFASVGSSTTTGASGLTYTIACELETAVANANADMGSMAFVTNAKVRGKARTTLKTSGATNSVMLWEAMQALYPCEVTNNVPATLGSGNKSALIFGAFDQLLIGLWSGQEIVVDPYSRSLYGEVQIVCFQEADVNARHEAAFAAAQDLVTT